MVIYVFETIYIRYVIGLYYRIQGIQGIEIFF